MRKSVKVINLIACAAVVTLLGGCSGAGTSTDLPSDHSVNVSKAPTAAVSADNSEKGNEAGTPAITSEPEATLTPTPEPTATPTPTPEPTPTPIPEIRLSLLGDRVVEADRDSVWQDPGVEAYDSFDENALNNVRIDTELDMSVCGVYEVTYTLESESGLSDSVSRTVYVRPNAEDIAELEAGGKIIYLTFDDGPSIYTDKLLKTLAKYDAKATFFLCNTESLYKYAEREMQEGHTIAIHSFTHDYKIYKSEETFFEDLYLMQDAIYEHTGFRPMISRFPGGGSNTVSKKQCVGIMSLLTKEIQEKGFAYFDWNVDCDDAGKARDAETVKNNTIRGVKGQRVSVVLMHDIHSYTVDAIEEILKWGTENGYKFLPLSKHSREVHHGVNN